MAINGTMVKIDSVTVPSGGQATIEFTNIPQIYDDLVIKFSGRSTRSVTQDNTFLRFNGTTTNYSYRFLYGTGSSASSSSGSDSVTFQVSGANATANTFGNAEVYISNYRSSNNKSYSVDAVQENNATTAYAELWAHLWSNTAAITSIAITCGASFTEHTTATLYGISRVAPFAKATGGMLYETDTHFYHLFNSSGIFAPTQSLNCDVLVIAGGGSGAPEFYAGGGGAGGVLLHTAQSLTAQNYTVTVGAGGAAGTQAIGSGVVGNNSQFGSLTASVGGGKGGGYSNPASPGTGGSGGGAGGDGGGGGSLYGTAGTGTTDQGTNGGRGWAQSSGLGAGGGGGGAGAAGANAALNAAGAGGAGTSTYSTWATATSTGVNGSYAGGGGGGLYLGTTPGSATAGGGAGGKNANGTNAIANTGGGGGGGGAGGSTALGGAGGSGIVIVRYSK